MRNPGQLRCRVAGRWPVARSPIDDVIGAQDLRAREAGCCEEVRKVCGPVADARDEGLSLVRHCLGTRLEAHCRCRAGRCYASRDGQDRETRAQCTRVASVGVPWWLLWVRHAP